MSTEPTVSCDRCMDDAGPGASVLTPVSGPLVRELAYTSPIHLCPACSAGLVAWTKVMPLSSDQSVIAAT